MAPEAMLAVVELLFLGVPFVVGLTALDWRDRRLRRVPDKQPDPPAGARQARTP
jgi:hypothetical protein